MHHQLMFPQKLQHQPQQLKAQASQRKIHQKVQAKVLRKSLERRNVVENLKDKS
jgi:hypothetical protein